MNEYHLTMSCPDGVGIVANVSGFIAEHGGWIAEANHHSDFESGYFFMRHVIKADSLPFGLDEFQEKFSSIANKYAMKWGIRDATIKKRIILMASKDSHCLVDLLSRWHTNELDCDIVAVISNHDDLRGLVEWYNVPYYHVPVDPLNKSESFVKVENIITELRADTIVLARYMQIIPPGLCEAYQHQIINIHHSFLPSFVGARPYHQAALRGVKLIGATCHYVTQNLDAGPIIEQDVTRISHADNVQDMIRLGRDIERVVLARGLRYHIEDRVLVHGNHTVVF